MSHRRRPALSVLMASLVAGLLSFGVLGCGSGSDSPEWALRLPDGAQYGAWSPDGEVFALPAHDRVELIGTDGSVERTIDVPGLDNSGLACECRLGWTEDGSEIHIVTRPRPQARGGVATVAADGKNLRTRHLDLHVADATWAPEGWPVMLVPGDTVHQAGERRPGSYPLLRLDSLEARPRVLLERRGEISDLSFSPDGTRFVFSEETKHGKGLWITSPEGGKPRLLLRVRGNPYVAWSPDGRALALNAARKSSLRYRLFLVSVSDGAARPLTEGPNAQEPPAWTPDGRWITYVGEDGSVNKVRRDGGEDKRPFERPDEEIAGLSWSPDGRHLVFTTRPIVPSG
jgi:dipeptidyl aminopeptidase/acylaminoacyl peptidase